MDKQNSEEKNFDVDKLFDDIRFELNAKELEENGQPRSSDMIKRSEKIQQKLDENYKFLNSKLSHKIEADIRNMRHELNKTYEVLKGSAESLESIQFGNLKNRLKDLHMYPNEQDLEEVIINAAMEGSDVNKLNSIMETKFKEHPGEFAGIPELSNFFQACTKMQHGLKDLGENREQMEELKKKVEWANVVTLQKIESLKRTINEECETGEDKYMKLLMEKYALKADNEPEDVE